MYNIKIIDESDPCIALDSVSFDQSLPLNSELLSLSESEVIQSSQQYSDTSSMQIADMIALQTTAE